MDNIIALNAAKAYTDNSLGVGTEGSSLIVNNVSDTQIHIEDSRKYALQSLTVHGNSTQDGTPSMDNPVEIVSVGDSGSVDIHVTGKNLLNNALLRKCVREYDSSTYKSVITYKGTKIEYPYTPAISGEGVGVVINVKKGEKYVFSVKNPNKNYQLDIAEYRNEEEARSCNNYVGIGASNNNVLQYTAKTDGVIVCAITGRYTLDKSLFHICTETELLQVEVGDTATEYEAYRGGTVTIPLTEPLRKITDTYKDRIFKDSDGVWKMARNTYTSVADADTEWIYHEGSGFGSNNYRCYFLTSRTMTAERHAILSDKFVTGLSDNSDGVCFQYKDQVYVYPSCTYDEFVEWLQENTITFVLPEVTPKIEVLSSDVQCALNALHTQYGITNITADGATVDASYVADTKLYIDKRITELASAIVATAE